jgi:aryl-alcohol dehydrogenase-like predicted oxidoreductase
MLPLCADLGVGVIPWSPLARGRLTRDWDEETTRSRTDEFGSSLYRPGDRVIVEQVARIASERQVPRRRSHSPGWPAGRVSPRRSSVPPNLSLSEAVAALDLVLTDAERQQLETVYEPHGPAGF